MPESPRFALNSADDTRPPAIGIDLGTTYSAVAYLDSAGRPQTIPNQEGDKLTPSVVFFDEDAVVVGKEALKAIATNASEIAQCMKRELGRRYYDKELGGRHYPPEALEAWVLDKVRRDAARVLGPFRQVVITVPAYFDEVRRKATQDAGYMAGLEVMDIINEPTAAAIAFGYEQGFLRESASTFASVTDPGVRSGRRHLRCDHHGNLRAATLWRWPPMATSYWAARIGTVVWSIWWRRSSSALIDWTHAKTPIPWAACGATAKTPNVRSRRVRRSNIPCDYQGHTIRVEVTRERFEDVTQDLLDRTAFTTRQTLQAAGLDWRQIDRILLVGGSTRMPAVIAMLTRTVGQGPGCLDCSRRGGRLWGSAACGSVAVATPGRATAVLSKERQFS